jgi:hypothetical protein
MGTDIYSLAEYKKDGEWKRAGEIFLDRFSEQTSSPFNGNRNYFLFSWLADVCSADSCVEPLSQPRGFPPDFDYSKPDDDDYLGEDNSYFYLSELLAVDYNITFLNYNKTKTITLEQYLGPVYIGNLEILKTLGEPENVRVVFGFG